MQNGKSLTSRLGQLRNCVRVSLLNTFSKPPSVSPSLVRACTMNPLKVSEALAVIVTAQAIGSILQWNLSNIPLDHSNVS